jgi:hypothetical protein
VVLLRKSIPQNRNLKAAAELNVSQKNMININSSLEFDRLLEALSSDIVNANIHWKLYCDLNKELEENQSVYTYAKAFWYLTLNAHRDVSLQYLCRAYDKQKIGLHLNSWLNTIQSNLEIFENQEFRKRLANNPFIESLSEQCRRPGLEQLQIDIQLCADTDELVKSLIQYRGNALAHRNAKMTAAGQSVSEKYSISFEGYETLLSRAQEILNRYSVLFKAASYSSQIVGHSDYKFVFESILAKIESYQ